MKRLLLVILFCLVANVASAGDFDQACIMFEAIGIGDAQKVEELLEGGFDPNQDVVVRTDGLSLAADKGQMEIVKQFLKHGADVNRKTYDVIFRTVSTPAMHAVQHAEVMKLLIAAGADVNFQFQGETILSGALEKGTPDVVKLLMSSGARLSNVYEAAMLGDATYINQYGNPASLNQRYGRDGKTPLIGCVKKGNMELTGLLLQKGADPNMADNARETPILIAVKAQNLNMVKLLAQYGADLRYRRMQISPQQIALETPLVLAVKKPEIFKFLAESGAAPSDLLEAAAIGDVESSKQFIDAGADANEGEWLTPLMAAAAGGNIEVIKLLLGSGADIGKPSRSGVTPLMMAAGKGNLAAVKELISAGADVNATSRVLAFSALAAAAANGHGEVVNELLNNGADVSLKSGGGFDALSASAFSGNLSMVKQLIQFGAVPGYETMYRAMLDKQYDIVDYLLSRGMDSNEKDRNGASYLEHAVVMGDEKLIKLLLTHGADINSRDANGVTALGHAGICHKYFLFDLLQSHGATL